MPPHDNILQGLRPILHKGAYIYAIVKSLDDIPRSYTVMEFRGEAGTTVILSQDRADELGLEYKYRAAWITLSMATALDAVGITAAFAELLANRQISCNVVAGYHHDHIFVPYARRTEALQILEEASRTT